MLFDRLWKGTFCFGCLALGASLTLVACGGDGKGEGKGTDSASDTAGDGDGDGDGDQDEPWAEWDPEVSYPLLSCDGLDPEYCAFPYPSNVYTVEDAETPTGRRLSLAAETMPPGIAPDPWNQTDGFSGGVPAMVHMPGATPADLATFDNIEWSLTDDSPTLLIEAETGERVPHIAELDFNTSDANRRTLQIRPAIRLEDDTRYIVVIRRVQGEDGDALPATPAFEALKNGTPFDEDPSIEARRGLYSDIFRRLSDQNVSVSELQLAWDFNTSSLENNTGWMLHMRDEALEMAGSAGPNYTITSEEVDPDPSIAFRLLVDLEVPNYITDDNQGGYLNFGDDGMPEPLGMTTHEVEILIPKSAETTPTPVVIYGHGLFGTKGQVGAGHFKTWADEYGYTMFAMDLLGMSSADSVPVGIILTTGKFEEFQSLVERQHQGLLNWLVAMRMMLTSFANDPTYGQYIDPTGYYYGISQGGIFGGSYVALSTDVERGALGVPGQPYRVLLERSVDFDQLFSIARSTWDDPRDVLMVLNHAQHLWDRTAPNGYTHRLGDNPLPNTPAHEVMLRVAKGDHQVTAWGAHIMARTIGVEHLDTKVREIFGFESSAAPIEGSGIVEWDFGLPPDPLTNVPQRECDDPHGKVRQLEEARIQLDEWFRMGTIRNTCMDGHCFFPEMSGCN